ncbi:V-type ATP synthase subunit I [Oceanirhabdus sp. W0125-5]|uniref:V-type ATP synthase subunit I n=1 Tax=Oceanirhabdus sp. W0125-5 TaxID=2999116 RepID=UPI0022F2BFAE|nr:V-type ATP synthase subunit I [Oceanirhabdus sp. W0125-5]WBW96020.1 V-type ATP synthase subunit I [Oceanirhabdus sp. W0125-5]
MAIVKMFKFNLFALQSSKKALLDKFQKLEEVQFLDFNLHKAEESEFLKADDSSLEINGINDKISDVNFALKLLNEHSPEEKGLKAMKEGKKSLTYENLEKSYLKLKHEEYIKVLKELDRELNLLGNEENKLLGEIEALAPWSNLDIGLDEIKNLNACIVEIGTIPLKNMESFKKALEESEKEFYLEEISADKDGCKVLVSGLKQNKEILDEIFISNSFSKVNIKFSKKPSDEVSSHKKRIKEIRSERIKAIEEIKKYSTHKEDLRLAYEFLSAELRKLQCYSNFSKSDNVVIMNGWVTEDGKEKFEKGIKDVCGEYYYIELNEAQDEENIPIKLKGNGFTEAFHSITEMYSLPNYKEVDPTPVLSFFYIIFFGMMLSDAGYGALMVIGTGIVIAKFNLDKKTKNFMKLFLYLGISTIIWGLVYGAFFGDILTAQYLGSETGLLSYFSNPLLDSQKQVTEILIISIVFGIIHVYIGLFMKAYLLFREGKYFDILCDVCTWYAAVTGLILWLAGFSPTIGMILSIAGLGGLLLTQGRDAESIGGKIGGGVYGLYGITGYIGDIVSYSRLMALGLATGSISMAFNSIVALVGNTGLNFALKLVLILLLFVPLHLFNFGINALGTYVHTSRLQYLEFFNKFYEGGGNKFKPLEAEKKYYEISEK